MKDSKFMAKEKRKEKEMLQRKPSDLTTPIREQIDAFARRAGCPGILLASTITVNRPSWPME